MRQLFLSEYSNFFSSDENFLKLKRSMASDVMHRKKLDRLHLSDSNFRKSENLNGLNVNMDFLSKFPKILVDERIHLF